MKEDARDYRERTLGAARDRAAAHAAAGLHLPHHPVVCSSISPETMLTMHPY